MLKKLFLVLLSTFAFSSAAFAIEFSADTIPAGYQRMRMPQMPGGMNFKRIK